MSKELTPLEALDNIKCDILNDNFENKQVKVLLKELEIVRKSLKDYEKATSLDCKTCKERKALNIIKDKRVDVGWLLHYIDLKKDDYTPLKWYNENLPLIDKDKELTHEEYDLLKEALL